MNELKRKRKKLPHSIKHYIGKNLSTYLDPTIKR